MIRLVVALDCEARPLLRHYRLKNDRAATGFRVYRNDDAPVPMALIVAGIGRTAAAAASAYLQGYLNDDSAQFWLNIGIGGARDHAIGDGFIAHKISESGTRQCWYPPLVFEPPCASAALMTVDRPETDYADDVIYEMEASGFYPTACRFASAELIQVLKIISDNRSQPPVALKTALIEQLIGDRLELIGQTIARLGELAREFAAWHREPADYRSALERWHFSESERHRLYERLQRWQLLCPDEPLAPDGHASGKEVLRWLEQRIAGQPVHIVPPARNLPPARDD